jgi:hypothetical protein
MFCTHPFITAVALTLLLWLQVHHRSNVAALSFCLVWISLLCSYFAGTKQFMIGYHALPTLADKALCLLHPTKLVAVGPYLTC